MRQPFLFCLSQKEAEESLSDQLKSQDSGVFQIQN